METQQRKYANKKLNACILQFGKESVFRGKVSRFNSFMEIKIPYERFEAGRERGRGRKLSLPPPSTHILGLNFDGF